MGDDKKQSDDKKYVQISREFIRHCSESIGFPSISNDIPVLLSEDVTYRLREVVQSAGQYMRHAKRKKLTNEDVNKALKWSDVEPVYGYSSSDPLPIHYVKEADVYCVEDHEINLVLMANGRHAFQHPGHPIVRAHWQALEGVQSSASSATGKKNGIVSTPVISEDVMNYYHQVTKAILGNDEEVTKAALDDLKSNSKIALLLPYFINFFSVGVKKVSHDLTQLTKLLNTVRSLVHNPHLYLEPQPFLKYIVQGVLYCIVEPLAASLNPINDHWALRDYASRLLANIIRLWNTPVNQLYEHTLSTLRDSFADLTKPFSSHYGAIVGIMALGAEPVRTCLYPNINRYWPHLQIAIDDTSIPNAPFKSDAHKVYGALLLASEFLILHLHGEIRVEQMEMDCTDEHPSLARETSSSVAESDSRFRLHKPCREDLSVAPLSSPLPTSVGDCKSKMPESLKREPIASMPKVVGASVFAGGSMEPPTPFSAQEIYMSLCGFFGDALAARLPYVQLDRFYVARPELLVNLFTTPDSLQTGEELLEAFNVKEEEVQSNSMEDDRYSYDDNSLMSDDGDGEPENVDLRIKSSVSDPIQGIKLTIAKLPRTQPSVTSTTAVTNSSDTKISKLSIKISKEQIVVPPPPPPTPPPPITPQVVTAIDEEESHGPFDVVRLRPPLYMEFNFEGAMPIPRHLLARKHPGGMHPMFRTPITSEVHRLSLLMKPVSRARRCCAQSPNQRLVRAFRSGCVTTQL